MFRGITARRLFKYGTFQDVERRDLTHAMYDKRYITHRQITILIINTYQVYTYKLCNQLIQVHYRNLFMWQN